MGDERLTNDSKKEELMALAAVGDDKFFRIALRSILTNKLRFREVFETDSFDEAMKTLAKVENISIALFDLRIPGLGSASALRMVREQFPATRVAVISQSEQRSYIIDALYAGVHGYIPKSLGPTNLTKALARILRGAIFAPSCLAELPSRTGFNERLTEETTTLTPRQRQILRFLMEGKSNKEIARSLGLGEGTVKIHIAALLRNLGVANRAAAAVAGVRLLPGELTRR
jgi:DNA-binding NarL/FixJ family response regulator